MPEQLAVLEICAGAGGQSHGLELADFRHEMKTIVTTLVALAAAVTLTACAPAGGDTGAPLDQSSADKAACEQYIAELGAQREAAAGGGRMAVVPAPAAVCTDEQTARARDITTAPLVEPTYAPPAQTEGEHAACEAFIAALEKNSEIGRKGGRMEVVPAPTGQCTDEQQARAEAAVLAG